MTKEVVPVDIGKLSKGLNTTFRGVAEIFDAIGAEEKPGFGIVEKTPDEEASEGLDAVSGSGDNADDVRSGAEVSSDAGADTQAADTGAKLDGNESDAVETDTEAAEAGDAGSNDNEAVTENDTPTTLTVDDLMKVAAQKIKLNRKNSEKIGALVKAYGQSSLKEMPPEKFEAFMTDLSQI